MRHVIHLSLALIALLVLPGMGAAAGETYLGVYSEQSDDPLGLRLEVVYGSPAALAGLQSGDVLIGIDGQPFSQSDTPCPDQLSDALAKCSPGDILTFTVFRDSPESLLSVNGEVIETAYPLFELEQLIDEIGLDELLLLSTTRHERTLDIPVVLGTRPGSEGQPLPSEQVLAWQVPARNMDVAEFLALLISKRGIEDDCADLLSRLEQRAWPDDGYRLSAMCMLLIDCLQGEAVTRKISDELATGAQLGVSGYYRTQVYAGHMLDVSGLYSSAPMLHGGITAEEHLDILELILETAALYVHDAFAAFDDEELAFIASQRHELTEIFRQEHYVHMDDPDPKRTAGNLQLLEYAKRVDYHKLLLAQLTLAQVAQADYLAQLSADLKTEFADRLDEQDLMVRETELGKLIISGTGSTWRRSEDLAVLIDLGGDDFYTSPAGSGISLEQPVGLIIELAGNDAYESTTPFSQGSGSLGCGLLIDATGNDQYIGLQWAQGCGYFGCGALLELAGDDIYRGEEFCQAAAIFGTGILMDYAGNDRVEGQMKCQAFGGASGVGLLIDVAGDDYRYVKGKYPTGYGDAGIFDAWGQGCAMGFRSYASGGIAGVIDLAGQDFNEAGNFSQGGGYYFGYGFFHDRGWEADQYVGSRYNQGFSAHQAVGVFLEEGGDDCYSTRQAVAQGLAWDECCSMFVDYSGNDSYEGGTGFSQGASAHNSLCVMWDRAGSDHYEYAAGQGRAGGNDYHGGTSLSLFIDEGGRPDTYSSERSSNNLVTGWPEHGFFADLPCSLRSFLADQLLEQYWAEWKE